MSEHTEQINQIERRIALGFASLETKVDRIESKLDQIICGFGDVPTAETPNYEHKALDVEIPVGDTDDRVSKRGQKMVDAILLAEKKSQKEYKQVLKTFYEAFIFGDEQVDNFITIDDGVWKCHKGRSYNKVLGR